MTDIVDRGARLVFDDKTRDYNHATDSEYKRLRSKADELFKKRNHLSQQSQQAYKNGDKQRAHELSEQSKKVLQEAESYNKKAAGYVFRENNTDSAEDEIDLHGLYVKEAEWFLQNRLANAIRTNQSHLKVIVGKGLHSANGIAKIKPAIDEMCDECNLKHRVDSNNSGVIVIDLTDTQSSQIPSNWDTTLSNPQQAYYGSSLPQYHQQSHQNNNQYQQQQQYNNEIKTGNQFFDLLIKGICMCLNK